MPNDRYDRWNGAKPPKSNFCINTVNGPVMGLYQLVVYERSLQVQVVIKSKQHAHLWLVYTYLQSTYFLMFFAILCAPIVDGHAVYFLLLPGPGGIIHKLLSGISPFLSWGATSQLKEPRRTQIIPRDNKFEWEKKKLKGLSRRTTSVCWRRK